jgi:hypothetical protein
MPAGGRSPRAGGAGPAAVRATAAGPAFSVEQLGEVDTLLFGRVTYDGMVAYWPTQQGSDYHTGIADTMNSIAKIVVSRTLKTADWTSTRLINTKRAGRTRRAQPATGQGHRHFRQLHPDRRPPALLPTAGHQPDTLTILIHRSAGPGTHAVRGPASVLGPS